MFAICLFPYQFYWFITTFDTHIHLSPELSDVFLWLTYTNTVLNAWIYGGFNPRFRTAYRHLVRCEPERPRKPKRKRKYATWRLKRSIKNTSLGTEMRNDNMKPEMDKQRPVSSYYSCSQYDVEPIQNFVNFHCVSDRIPENDLNNEKYEWSYIHICSETDI